MKNQLKMKPINNIEADIYIHVILNSNNWNELTE